ncbi:hypothetical protein V1522DRAFT_110141 [Lipomyces starkeyi]
MIGMHSCILSFKNFSYPHTAKRHQELLMETILNFGLQTKVIGCVSDNEEATVQGMRAVKTQLERDYKNSSFNALRCAVHSMQLSLKPAFKACCDQLTLTRDLNSCKNLSAICAKNCGNMPSHCRRFGRQWSRFFSWSCHFEVGHRNQMEFHLCYVHISLAHEEANSANFCVSRFITNSTRSQRAR